MNVRDEVKSLIAKKGTTLTKVCSKIQSKNNKKFALNSIINKFARKTIKFEEVQLIVNELGYKIEFTEM